MGQGCCLEGGFEAHSTGHNNLLPLKPIELEEFKDAVKQMENDKASGPDGFTANFFHAYWDWLKEEV